MVNIIRAILASLLLLSSYLAYAQSERMLTGAGSLAPQSNNMMAVESAMQSNGVQGQSIRSGTVSQSGRNEIGKLSITSENRVQGNVSALSSSSVSIGNTDVGSEISNNITGPAAGNITGPVVGSLMVGPISENIPGQSGEENATLPNTDYERGFELFRLADCAYEACVHSLSNTSWSPLSPDKMKELGIDSNLLRDSFTGYSATIFQNKDTGEYVVAFRGTDELVKDMVSNVVEIEGLSFQHFLALQLAENLRQRDIDVTYVGHSLGGGLAVTAAMSSGREAVTYNSAGISKKTAELGGFDEESDSWLGFHLDESSSVTAYRVKGDDVSFWTGADGSTVELPNPNPVDVSISWRGVRVDNALATEHGRDKIYESFKMLGYEVD